METNQIPPAAVLPEMVSKRLKLLSQSRSMPDRKSAESREVKNLSRLDRLNLWVQDPILRTEAEREARSAGYAIEYNAIGIATRITEIDDYEDF